MIKSFDQIYKNNVWGSSGTGSRYTRDNVKLVKDINLVIKKNNIKTVCDFGCGDFQIMKHLDFENIKYTGIDIVEFIIKTNIENYKHDNIDFKNTYDKVENFDLVIIKDVLQHHTDYFVINKLQQLIDDNKFVFCINGYKFQRDKTKNDWNRRSIDNLYRYHPLSSDKHPLDKFTQFEIEKYTHRCKEYILYKK